MSNMDEELSYVSSSPILATQQPKTKPQEELDLPTLKKVQNMIVDEIAARKTTDRLTIDETHFTVKQQLAMNQEIALILSEIKLTIDSAITNVKEKYER